MQGFQSFLAPAKINLFLHITGRRADGYHLLQSVFRLLDFYDVIHIKVRSDGTIARAKEIVGVPEQDDLCIRAAKLLKEYTGCTLGAEIAADKRIPMGGGLGGGSSDAATVLLALNSLWKLNLGRQALMDIGLQLGADVPFFIFGENAWVEGIGEQMQAVALQPAHYVLLTPQIHVSTAEVFSAEELTRNTIPTTIAAFSGVLPESGTWSGKEKAEQHQLFRNDLESVVCQRNPAIASCLEWLIQFQAANNTARMSGSGASVFLEVESREVAQEILFQAPAQMDGIPLFACEARGLERHPLYNSVSNVAETLVDATM